MKIISLFLIVFAGVLYQIFSKNVVSTINPFACLIITYSIATIMSLILYLVTSDQPHLAQDIKKINIFSIGIGIMLCLLDFGYITGYRSGFKASELSPLAYSLIIIFVSLAGFILFKEKVTLVCIAGLCLICSGILVMMFR